eukprot:4030170-Pyramimonas_sp.AAC.1
MQEFGEAGVLGDLERMNSIFMEVLNQATLEILYESPLYTESHKEHLEDLKRLLAERRELRGAQRDDAQHTEKIKQLSKRIREHSQQHWHGIQQRRCQEIRHAAKSQNNYLVQKLARLIASRQR